MCHKTQASHWGLFQKNCKQDEHSYNMVSRERKRTESDLGPLLSQEVDQCTLKKVISTDC